MIEETIPQEIEEISEEVKEEPQEVKEEPQEIEEISEEVKEEPQEIKEVQEIKNDEKKNELKKGKIITTKSDDIGRILLKPK